jgi:hypothetical protein
LVFATNCVCGMIVGLRDLGMGPFWRIVAAGEQLTFQIPMEKKWYDIFDALGRKQQAGENSEFESPHRLFGHGGARNRALVGGLDNPKLRTAPGYPAKKLAGGSLPKDKTLDHSDPTPTASQPQPRAVTFHGVHSVWALVRWPPPCFITSMIAQLTYYCVGSMK